MALMFPRANMAQLHMVEVRAARHFEQTSFRELNQLTFAQLPVSLVRASQQVLSLLIVLTQEQAAEFTTRL